MIASLDPRLKYVGDALKDQVNWRAGCKTTAGSASRLTVFCRASINAVKVIVQISTPTALSCFTKSLQKHRGG